MYLVLVEPLWHVAHVGRHVAVVLVVDQVSVHAAGQVVWKKKIFKLQYTSKAFDTDHEMRYGFM